MLYEFKSRTLVMLCNMNEDGGEASYPFFPGKEEEPVKYGKMVVTLQSKASYTDFIVRKFSMQEDKVAIVWCVWVCRRDREGGREREGGGRERGEGEIERWGGREREKSVGWTCSLS
jgi:hypothetical protein